MSTALELQNINKTFGGTQVVSDVSFAVKAGEIFGLLGPNGAGKTTTIRCILGIMYPDSGRINFNFGSDRHVARSAIGYLPEERGLYK
ncbi:MAG: ATP-binding cassette domain-containing protein, partial [Thermaerobacter sp.]|nr:ATP-binding cassette domain-containing protein [Thermaerobacter sp.]